MFIADLMLTFMTCIDQVYLHTAPLCHIGGISSALAMLMAGACHVITPKFEAKSAFEAIREHEVTSLITVPTMMADLVSYHSYVVFVIVLSFYVIKEIN